MIVFLYVLVNLVSGWQCGVAVNTESRLHPRYKQRRSMRTKNGLKKDFFCERDEEHDE